MNYESQADLIIDMSHRDDFVNVNIDITMKSMPCDILSLDVQDILGTHKQDVFGDTLHKIRLNKNGERISEETQMDTH